MQTFPANTIQGFDLRYFAGPIDPLRGHYARDAKVSRSLQKLYSMIGTDQFVWCSRSLQSLQYESGRYLHQMSVCTCDLIAVIDTLHWCQIIGYDARYIPSEEHEELKYAAVASNEEYDTALKVAEDDYLLKHQSNDPWRVVVRTKVEKLSDQLLVRFPIRTGVIECVKLLP